MTAVVDTSAVIALSTLRQQEQDPDLADRLTAVVPHAPDIIDAEFHHALRGLLLGGKISSERAHHARAIFSDMPLRRMPTRLLTDRVWSLRHNLGAYDASFIALAEALDAPLITCDVKQSTASGHRAAVERFLS